jgi:TPR repeat protein
MVDDFPQLIKKAATGDDAAMEALLMHFKQQTITVPEQEQLHLFLKQASRLDHHAIYLRGLLYEHGYGVKQDLDMAFLLMREAASKGNASAIYGVGRYFLLGIGVTKNHTGALQWLQVAAESPHYIADAMYHLGRMYEEGLGVEVDMIQAKKWYEKAAEKGHVAAKTKLI